MSTLKAIRKRLSMSQTVLGDSIGVSQGAISAYEKGRIEMPPDVARRLICVATERGIAVTFDDIYRLPEVGVS